MSQTPTTAASNNADSDRPAADRLTTMAHETIDRVADTAHRAGNEVRTAATKAADTAKHTQEHAAAAIDANLRKVRSYVERNPLIAVGIAAGVAALLTALVRR